MIGQMSTTISNTSVHPTENEYDGEVKTVETLKTGCNVKRA